MLGLKNVLQSVEKTDTIKTFVLTSSLSAMVQTHEEPERPPGFRYVPARMIPHAQRRKIDVLSENHWNDVSILLNENKWFSYTKTC